MKETTRDFYIYKNKNRKLGGKGDNLFKLGEYFGVKNDIPEIGTYADLQVGSVSYNLFHHIINILSSKYKIKGLPKHLKLKDFWMYFVSGQMIFFEHEGQLLFSQYTPDEYDLYFNPIKVQPIFPNEMGGESQEIDKKTLDYGKGEFVEVLFNPQRKSLLLILSSFLSDLQFTYDEMKYDLIVSRPTIYVNGVSQDDLIADELNKKQEERNLFKILYNQVDTDGEETNNLFSKLTSELNEKVEIVQGQSRVDSVIIPSMDIIENYIYELLGINRNDNKNKKERMVVDEVNVNNETKEFATDTIYSLMKDGFDEINETFGVNITIDDPNKEDEPQIPMEVENE